jgi:3-oxochol-4-en-24-oyl-CoA dehydrogenase
MLAFTAMSHRLLLRQLSGLRPGAEASVLKVIHGLNLTALRRAALGWAGAGSAALRAPEPGDPAHAYLSLPPTLIGGGTIEIQLNVIGEQVLGLPKDTSLPR